MTIISETGSEQATWTSYGMPWPPEGDPWRERTLEFHNPVHWRFHAALPHQPGWWELVEAPSRTVVRTTSLIVWLSDERATKDGFVRVGTTVTFADGRGTTAIYRIVHIDRSHGDSAVWLEWVD